MSFGGKKEKGKRKTGRVQKKKEEGERKRKKREIKKEERGSKRVNKCKMERIKIKRPR
jgi:hypothetical protein